MNDIWSYQYDAIVERADNLRSEIELLIDNMFSEKYKIINIVEEDWQR